MRTVTIEVLLVCNMQTPKASLDPHIIDAGPSGSSVGQLHSFTIGCSPHFSKLVEDMGDVVDDGLAKVSDKDPTSHGKLSSLPSEINCRREVF